MDADTASDDVRGFSAIDYDTDKKSQQQVMVGQRDGCKKETLICCGLHLCLGSKNNRFYYWDVPRANGIALVRSGIVYL